MQEAFLLQMNDFDRFLETQLRQMLDPVVATQPPGRARRRKAGEPVIVVLDQTELVVVPDAVPVAVVASPIPQL